jgi:hypothetical protein
MLKRLTGLLLLNSAALAIAFPSKILRFLCKVKEVFRATSERSRKLCLIKNYRYLNLSSINSPLPT